MIKARLGDEYHGRKIRYVFQWMLAGTAHSLSIARPFLSGRFLLLNADDIHGPAALAEMVKHPLSLLVSPHKDPHKFGVVTKKGDGTLDTIIEKPENPTSNLVSTGAMVLDERVFDYEAPRHTNGEYYITDPFGALAKDYPMQVIEQDLWIPVGYPE